MRIATMLVVAFATPPSSVYAAQSYDSYDAFYSSQSGAVFDNPVSVDADPIEQNAGVVYSYPGKPGIFTKLQARVDRRTLSIELWKDRMVVNGKGYRFVTAKAFPGEHVSEIPPESAKIFVAMRTHTHPPLLCVEGHANASGEAGSRYTQISLLIDPLARKPTFLHLPSLLSSCQAVRMLNDGKLAFPKNSYLYDEMQKARVGLLMSYFTFLDRRFVPTLNEIRLRFALPEIPFQFSVQE
ncbi:MULTISPECIES: hypothetical protein [Cupriavidus]|jgi:hypothetical protein|uniref:Uncharacterized protein n=2 Tax=Cupriavidus metallidurans TaxID=119219 RepID=A0A132HQ07_9BURK|nr:MULTISPECIES: hypothetical protein [Cupriavidus]KWR78466.1 hypothetical protein RN01_23670 [Cupriavidus sp. SHE]KWW38161.1 hypothetical protein AU374_01942 [Cupriavidus metallidurans]QBP09632.1 hypothetical protein DDF84_007585 [Cupriavidus metallidurans]QWC89982.1 hypothetical protein KB891_07265 [Cupriavidus metallidurans]